MTLTLAIRNLIHDRVRLVVTLTGVAFAVVLITAELGLFLGFASTTSALIDELRADIWVVPKGTRNVDQTPPLSERRRYQALSTPGVEAAELFITEFVRWQKPDGGVETVLVVGFEPDGVLAGPWNVTAGSVADLKRQGTIFIDELYADKLAVTALGQTIEMHGKRARVVGLTSGIRSFTQSPYVFASLKSSRDYALLRGDQAKHVLVKLVKGADVEVVKGQLAERLPGVDVYTTREFSDRTRYLLDVHDRRRPRLAGRFVRGPDRRLRGGGADAVRDHDRPYPRVRHAARDRRRAAVHQRRGDQAGADQRRRRLQHRVGAFPVLPLCCGQCGAGDRDAVAVGTTGCRADGTDVHRRGPCLHTQGHEARSSDGLQMTGSRNDHPVIIARSLTKTFLSGEASVPALRGVSLDIRRGEVTLLRGPSGSGKTTLLSVFGCILSPDGGSLRIGMRNVLGLTEQERAAVRLKEIGFVFQGFNLFPTLHVVGERRDRARPARHAAPRREGARRRSARPRRPCRQAQSRCLTS